MLNFFSLSSRTKATLTTFFRGQRRLNVQFRQAFQSQDHDLRNALVFFKNDRAVGQVMQRHKNLTLIPGVDHTDTIGENQALLVERRAGKDKADSIPGMSNICGV